MLSGDKDYTATGHTRAIRCALWLATMCLTFSTAHARALHVSSARGDDHHDGLAADRAFRTIQRAADVVEPGDEVIIHAGVYFERVTLGTKGTEERPVVFRADAIEQNRVILTGADRRIRSGGAKWSLEDDRLGLYSVEYAGEMPSRVLYSGTDLFPYATLEQLKAFTTDCGPAPQHGHFYDQENGRLYVRLHASGRYGRTNPAEHPMAISPSKAFGFTIAGAKPSYAAIEGITFETPGNAAVLTEGNFVDVRRCWFVGCPYGVRGTRRSQPADDGRDESASHVTISYCDFHEFPAFEDVEELLRLGGVSENRRGTWVEIWHRKTAGERGFPGGRHNFENGIAALIGDNWRIHHNNIHDGFEGLANDGPNWATNLHIHDNVFARLCDNAIEVENHARNVFIYRNVMRDVMEPFSYQPLAGPPWPGPIRFYKNLIVNTREHAARWRYAMPHQDRAAFKLGISHRNWEDGFCEGVSTSPLVVPGLEIDRNTVVFSGGRLISIIGSYSTSLQNVRFTRNVFATDVAIADYSPGRLEPGHFEFRNNLTAAPRGPTGSEESQLTAGEGGRSFPNIATLWSALRDDEPNGESTEDAPLGALQPQDEWLPLRVGPVAAPDETSWQSLEKLIAQ